MTDSEVLAGIKNGDRSALANLYRDNYKMVSHFILSNNGSESDAKEVYQEAVIIFYEKVKTGLLVLNCRISTFLYSISRRLWLRKLAEQKPFSGKIEEFEEFIVIEQEPEEYTEANFESMASSMEMLGQPCRGIVEDYYLYNKSMQQISEKYGYTNADNAKNQKYKCLNRLKKLFFGHK